MNRTTSTAQPRVVRRGTAQRNLSPKYLGISDPWSEKDRPTPPTLWPRYMCGLSQTTKAKAMKIHE
uniref:Uncharacterized protein n=1 Tax=Romanomermis culicivorax TaxID=13658 RepID=A0A915HJT2_ROMCU